MQPASYIDHTILKQTTTLQEVQQLCVEAVQWRFAAVCVPPVYVAHSMGFLKSSGVKVCTVVGFPFGYHHIETKIAEAATAVKDGAEEIDVVANITAIKNKDWKAVEEEMATLATFSKAHACTLKLIIESGVLTNEEIIAVCNIAARYPIHFLKTSTGYAAQGASVAAVQLMRACLPSSIAIKASGGIKTWAFAKELIEAGATRIGTSSGVALVQEAQTL